MPKVGTMPRRRNRRCGLGRSLPAKAKKENWNDAWARVPHALIDDISLSADARALLIYRLSRTRSWTLHWKDIRNRFGWSKSRTYSAMAELIDRGYLVRRQSRPQNGRWGRAQEVVELGAVPADGRPGFQLLPRKIVDDRRLSGRDLLALAWMRSHAPGWSVYPGDLAKILGCHRQTALKVLGNLMGLGFVVRLRLRGTAGKFGGAVYRLAEHRNQPLRNNPAKNRETVSRATENEDPYESSPHTNDQQKRRSYVFRLAKDAGPFSIDWSWQDALPEKFAEDFNVEDAEVMETYREISDEDLLGKVLDAADGRVHESLMSPSGLSPARIFMAVGASIEQICDIIRRRVGRKPGKFLNGWALIAIPLAAAILEHGLDGDDET